MSDSEKPLTNSRRRFEKRTYTPIFLAPPGQGEFDNALGLANQVRALMISEEEFRQLPQRVTTDEQATAAAAMEELSTAVSVSSLLSAAATLSRISPPDLKRVAAVLGSIRSEASKTLVEGLKDLSKEYDATAAAPESPSSSYPPPSVAQPPPVPRSPETLRADPLRITKADATHAGYMPAASRSVTLHTPPMVGLAPGAARLALVSTNLLNAVASDQLLNNSLGQHLVQKAPAVVSWAMTNASAQLRPLLDVASVYTPSSSVTGTTILSALSNLARLRLLPQLFAQSLTERPLQPVGLLHLERLEMTPSAVERGELAYSLPLAPDEKVTLAHREWSVREEQFSEFIEDYLENYSEQGVAQTDDMAMSTSTQSSHNDALSMNQPVAAANGVHVTSPFDTTKSASSSVNDVTTKEESKAQSRTITALASTRTMKDHKISFTVTTVSGMEDFTAHLIENKYHDKSMRIDYFKRVRKWRSDLYRYGVRLTYDVVLPDPGAQLRRREIELQQIAQELATEFRLDLQPSDIQVSNWEQLADEYGVVLPPPPDQVQQLEQAQAISYSTPYDVSTAADGTKWNDNHRIVSMSVTVPQGLELNNLNIFAHVQAWPDEPNPSGGTFQGWVNAYAGQSVRLATRDASAYCDIDWNLGPSQVPSEGLITVIFRMQLPESGLLKLTATIVPSESTMESWRLACWSAIRDTASAMAAQHRAYLRDKQAALQKQIAGDDPVRLRRMEREAIMRAVLDWLFPGFEDANSILANLPSPGSLDPGTWQRVMEYGEYIKFVQSAIDWDNVMVFLYPYFWDTVRHQWQKLFLDHPDPIHREFLRAGAARVIVAIQPGFEDQVVSLLDQGQLGNLGEDSRFARVIKDVQEANAAYQLTTQGGGSSEDPKQPGVLIGSWTDFTPSSALDIQVTLQAVGTG